MANSFSTIAVYIPPEVTKLVESSVGVSSTFDVLPSTSVNLLFKSFKAVLITNDSLFILSYTPPDVTILSLPDVGVVSTPGMR